MVGEGKEELELRRGDERVGRGQRIKSGGGGFGID